MRRGTFRIQIQENGGWHTCRQARTLRQAQAIAREIQATGHQVRIVRTITHQ